MRMEDFVRIVAFLILSIILLNFCAFGQNESDNIELRIVTKSGNTIVPGETLVAQLVKDDNTQILSDNVIWYTSEDGENFSEEEHVGKEYIVTWENAMKLKFIKATVNYQEVTYESVVQVDEVPSDILTGKGRRGSDSGWDIPANALENSPKENMFTVGNQDFVLLDTFHNEQSTFYVIAKGLYGQKAFSTVNTNRFDPDNENNIAYFLNNDFLKDGNSGKKLPEDIIKYINMDHVWITEPGGSEGDAKDAYTVRAGVTLMADWEFCKYADRFGLIDGNYVAGQTTVYWFRTAFGLEKRGDMMMEYRMAYKNFYTKASTGVSNIRPQFMLSKEFFKNVKPTNIGSNVVKAMMKVYNLDELVETGLYSEDELLKLGFKKINMSSKLSVPGQPSNILENIGGVYDLQANIYLDNTVNMDLDVSVIVCLYDENESLVNSSFINVTVPHHSRNNAYTIPIQNTDGRAITFRTFIYDGHLSNKYLKTDEQLGENTASVVFDTNNSILEIEGKTFINGTVRILIFSPAAYAESDWTDDVNSGIIYYLSELVADKNGAFTATISMAEEKGKYCVLINFPHQSGWKSYEFFYADITDYQNLVSDMNSAADADDVEAVIKHPLYSQILNLSLPMYDKLSPQDKEKIDFQNIYSIMAEKDTYSSILEIETYYKQNLVTWLINIADTTSQIKAVYDEYKVLLGFKNTYDLYDYISKTDKDCLQHYFEALLANDFRSYEDMQNSVMELIVLTGVKYFTNWTSVRYMLESELIYFEQNGMKTSVYNNLNESEKNQIAIDISGNEYANIKELINDINTKIQNSGESSRKTSRSGGGTAKRLTTEVIEERQKEVPVTITPKEEFEEFDDLSDVEWAKESILYLWSKGIINGKGQGKFYPNDYITREEFTKMFVLALDIPVLNGDTGFNDVDSAAWYNSYVYTAQKEGIVFGNDMNCFGVGSFITRQDLAVMIYRVIKDKVTLPSEKKNFKDYKEIAEYASAAVDALAGLKIVNGNEAGEFMPQQFCTRAQAAVMIFRMLKLYNGGN